MESVIAEVADELAGKAVVGKIYAKERELFQKFGIRGIPAFFVMRDGEIKQSFRGSRPKATLLRALKKLWAVIVATAL